MDKTLIPGAAIGSLLLAAGLFLLTGGLINGEQRPTAEKPPTPAEETRQGEAAANKAKRTAAETTANEKEGYTVYERPRIKQLSSRITGNPETGRTVPQRIVSRNEDNESPAGTDRRAAEASRPAEKADKGAGVTHNRTSHYEYLGTFKLTAYTAGPESTGKDPGDPGYGLTYSGAPIKRGVTAAADLSVLPLGTVVYIEGVGKRVIEDKGGGVNGKHIDVYFKYLDKALAFGVQEAKVYVIEWGKG